MRGSPRTRLPNAGVERIARLVRPCAVASFVVALAVGCGGDDQAAAPSTTPPRSQAASTAPNPNTTNAGAPAELEYLALPPPPLKPGLVTTTKDFGEPTVVFRVPRGWNGSEDDESFGIGKGVDLEAEDFDRASIYAYRMSLPFARATAKLTALPGLEVVSEKPAPRVGGFGGRIYEVNVPGEPVVLEPVGIRNELDRGKAKLTVYNVRGIPLLIDVSGDTDADRAEAERVLRSFRFPD